MSLEHHDTFSEGEIALIVSGVNDNFRIDGRSCFETRRIRINTGVVSSCNGSAQVQSISCNIIVGVKVEVGPPLPNQPDCGILEFSAECSANAGPQFEGRRGESMSQEIVFALTNSFTPSIDKRCLCISKSHKVWIVHVDVLVLECSCISQIIDLSAMAVKAALMDTRVPRLIADEEDGNDFVLAPNFDEYCPIDTTKLPILLTLTRIHDQYVADVTEEEAAAGQAQLTLAFDSEGQLSYTKKWGLGSLHADPLKEILAKASTLAIQLHKNLLEAMQGKNKMII